MLGMGSASFPFTVLMRSTPDPSPGLTAPGLRDDVSLLFIVITCLLLGAGPFGYYYRRDAAAGTEISLDLRPDGLRPADDIFEHLVDDVFLEDSEIAVGLQILFQRLQLQAIFRGHVADGEDAEIRQAGLGANRGELGIIYDNFVTLKLVGPSLNLRKLGVESGGRVFRRVTRFCHRFNLNDDRGSRQV